MSHGESMNASGFNRFFSQRVDGISTTLKVGALAAGYAAFVWLTMYQVEHGFSALTRLSTTQSSARPIGPETKTVSTPAPSGVAQSAAGHGLTRVGDMASGAPLPVENR